MNKINKKFLVIAPHQDDEIIGCGGTILQLLERSCSVAVIHVFSGTSGADNNEQKSSKIRLDEAKEAAIAGGYQLLDNLGFKDRLDTNHIGITNKLIAVIRKYQPQVIFAPHDDDQDFEHQVVAKSAWEAAWLASSKIFPSLGQSSSSISQFYGYEIWRPMRIVTSYIDITKYMAKKKLLLRKFKSQMKNTSWVEGSLGLNAYRGATLQGYGYVEAFFLKIHNSNISLDLLSTYA